MSDRERILMEAAKRAAHAAQKAGASDARVFLSRSRSVEVEWRDGRLDRIRESTSQALSLDLYVQGRYSSSSTSDIRDDQVQKHVQRMVDMTRYLAPDTHRRLPDPTRYQGAAGVDLQADDPFLGEVTPEMRLRSARLLEEAARGADAKRRIVSVTSAVGDSEDLWVGFATNGFEASERGTSFGRSLEVSVADRDDRKPSGTSYGATRRYADLPAESALGLEAIARAEAELGSRQIPTGRYEVIVENRAAPGLAYQILGPLAGAAVQQKRSFLGEKLGEKVGADRLTVTCDPHLARGLASSCWDPEGMATRRLPVFERGVLRTFFLDTYYASKLGVEPTTGELSNFVWEGGARSAAAMVKEMAEGIWITSFLGGNSNATTGDFSLGIRGFYVKGGEVVHPVSEMNIAGNHLEFWQRLTEVGNDPWPYSPNRTPTLRFADVDCSGT